MTAALDRHRAGSWGRFLVLLLRGRRDYAIYLPQRRELHGCYGFRDGIHQPRTQAQHYKRRHQLRRRGAFILADLIVLPIFEHLPRRIEDIDGANSRREQTALRRLPEFVRPREQIAERFPHSQRQPALATMLVLVMQHVTALTERLQVARTVVRGSWSRCAVANTRA